MHLSCCYNSYLGTASALRPIMRGQSYTPTPFGPTKTLQQMLIECRDEIVARFTREVEHGDVSPPGLPHRLLVDHIPDLLDTISAQLVQNGDAPPDRRTGDVSSTAGRHGEQRWSIGYDLQAVVREYGVLCRVILEVARARQVSLGIDEFEILAESLNAGVAQATAKYVRFRDEQLNAQRADLELLVEAGEQLASSLDLQSTLSRLTRLLVPRLADFCIVHLEGRALDATPVAHTDPGKTALLGDLVKRLGPPDQNPDGYSTIIRSGKPVLVENTSEAFGPSVAEMPEQPSLFRELGVCSWLTVPLRVQSNTLGAVTLALSESQRHYTRHDLMLAEELARRAATAIDNARLYELAREERARVAAVTRAKDEFVATVSHELRTPLNVIIGWTRLLRSGGLSEKSREHALEVLERNANAQSQLVADLLDVSRVITGNIRLEPALIDFGELVLSVAEDARVALEAKQIRLHWELDEGEMILRGDAVRLRQIVWNLLSNAVKFTPRYGEIWLALRRGEGNLELSVRDTGIGIPSEFLPRIFEIFRQVDSKTTRAHGGLGIGLSIAKHLVDLHGGSLEVHSAGIGHGACFSVRLPTNAVLPSEIVRPRLPPTRAPEQDCELPEGLGGMTVLVVDDQPDALGLLRTVLESRGIHVLEATNARDALMLVKARRIDLVISDIGMPHEDGYALIRSLRTLRHKQKSSIPAIALTAFAHNEDRRRALLEGFNVHLAKPVDLTQLLWAVADLSGRVVRKAKGE
jgi:signal transduction histidine kinase/ActR/RegA family two-component response regulator